MLSPIAYWEIIEKRMPSYSSVLFPKEQRSKLDSRTFELIIKIDPLGILKNTKRTANQLL